MRTAAGAFVRRLGWLATEVCHGPNGYDLIAPQDDAYDRIIALAAGETDYREGAALLESWTVPQI
jgi:death-on-curing protein